MRSPARMRVVKSRISVRPPKALVTPASSATIFPERAPSSTLQPDLPEAVAPRRALEPQLFQAPHAALVARAPRLDALPDPHLLLRQHLVEAGVGDRFVGQLPGLLLLIRGEASRIAPEPAAIELDDARGDRVEKAAVVGDADHGAGEALQQPFEPADGGEVEMVGGLVEQQHVGLSGQRPRQRDALLPAAGQRSDQRVGGQLEPRQHRIDAIAERPAADRVEPRVQRVDGRERARIVAVVGEARGRVVIIRQHLALRRRGRARPHRRRCSRRRARAPAGRRRCGRAAPTSAHRRPGRPARREP